MLLSFHRTLLLIFVVGWTGSGCTQHPPLQPSLRVVDAAVHAPGVHECSKGRSDTARLFRAGEYWYLRVDPIWDATPRARRLLATGSEDLPSPTHHPDRLPQEEKEEQARLRALVAENEKAMRRLDDASATLAEAAQALLRRTERLTEPSSPPRKTTEPTP